MSLLDLFLPVPQIKVLNARKVIKLGLGPREPSKRVRVYTPEQMERQRERSREWREKNREKDRLKKRAQRAKQREEREREQAWVESLWRKKSVT